MLKPIYKDTAIGEDTKCVEYDEIFYFPDTSATSYIIVSSFNVSNLSKEVNVQVYLGDAYASTNNLYVICEEYIEVENSTKVYKFSLNGEEINYVANTSVPGEIEDQFSVDEYNG